MYSALIRTHNSASTLARTLASLAAQSVPPSELVIVDSGSTDDTLRLLPAGAIVQPFIGERFNYSEALNQGLDRTGGEHVLVISSHTSLAHPDAVAHALALLRDDRRLGAVSFAGDEPAVLEHELIDRSNFDGFNGVWNTATLFDAALLRSRRFRPEVFSAEDQEWSRWLCQERNMALARLRGSGVLNANPRRQSRRKLLNEYLAIAIYANSSLLSWKNIVRVGCSAIKPALHRSIQERGFKLELFARLVACRFVTPSPGSRYF